MYLNQKPENITEDLLTKCKQNDMAAFRGLINKYQKYAYALAFKILMNEDDSKDAVQETFIRIWKHIGKYNFQIKFTTWLYKIVVNICYDKLRSRKRKYKIESHEIEMETLIDINHFSKSLDSEEFVGVLNTISNELPEKQRIVFVLRDLEDMSIEQVSEVLGMPVHSVKTNLVFARKKIRLKLEKYI
jgi:RNA polymerase sigma-70 factor (ECF subfamily)